MIAVIRTSTNRIAVNVRAVGKSKYSAPKAHATQTTAANQANAQAMNRSAFMAAITQDASSMVVLWFSSHVASQRAWTKRRLSASHQSSVIKGRTALARSIQV